MASINASPRHTAAFVASLCVALLSPAAAQLVRCYSCVESVTVPNSVCADPSRGNLPSEGDCERCQVSINSNTSGDYYSRGCTSLPEACVKNLIPGITSRCVCSGALCNRQVITTNVNNVECYVCSSAALIDNGCGKILDETSPFVSKMSGCTACGLTVSEENDGSGYRRRCLKDVPDTNSCAFKEDPSNSGCTSRCTTNLCNSANQRGASSSAGLALALLVVAALNKLV